LKKKHFETQDFKIENKNEFSTYVEVFGEHGIELGLAALVQVASYDFDLRLFNVHFWVLAIFNLMPMCNRDDWEPWRGRAPCARRVNLWGEIKFSVLKLSFIDLQQ
jgi:hypothetical protein